MAAKATAKKPAPKRAAAKAPARKAAPKPKPPAAKKPQFLRDEYFKRMFTSSGAASHGGAEGGHSLRLERALNQAHDARSFEIAQYWRRATFFWGFESVVLLGLILALSYGESPFFLSLLTIAGMVVSAAWTHANMGSKFWQENWELHIDLLEEKITGNLTKNVLTRNASNAFSVSRINERMSVFFFLMWMLLFGDAIRPWLPGDTFDLPVRNVSHALYGVALVYIVASVILWVFSTQRSGLAQKPGVATSPLHIGEPAPITLFSRDVPKKA